MPSATRFFALTIVALVILLASVVVAEVGLRLLPEKALYRDTALTTRTAAPWPEVDFRNRTYERDKAPGTFRILVLGDSYTWGFGLHPEDAYPDRLEQRLGDLESEVEFEVVNWSSPGWSTALAWRSLRDQLSLWSPDLLILGFVFNDPELVNLSRHKRQELFAQVPTSGIPGWLYRHSHALSGLYDVVEYRRVRERLVDYYHSLFEDPEGWEACKRALAGLHGLAREQRIPFLLVIFPIFDSQLDGDYRYHRLHELMATTAAEMKIKSLDLLPAYQGIDARRLAVTPFIDPHPSELAQRIAADVLARRLVKRGLVPAHRPPKKGSKTLNKRPGQ